MIKYISYHFLYLFNKKTILFLLGIFLLSFLIFFYLAGGFYSEAERLIMIAETLKEYNKESFLFINIIIGLWIINSSKEIFTLQEPHVVLINRQVYIYTKIIGYYLFYFFMCLFMYFIMQVALILLYGFRPFNYLILLNLIINILLTHLFILLVSGYNKNLLFTILFSVIYIIINGLYFINNFLIEIVLFFLPFLNHLYPIYGYYHLFLVIVLLFTLTIYKHLTYLD